MKKILALFVIGALMFTTLIFSTLALYQSNANINQSGSVNAAYFAVTSQTSQNYELDVNIAPSESIIKEFSISNFDDEGLSEVSIDLDISVEITNANDDVSAISGLTIELIHNNEVVDIIQETSTDEEQLTHQNYMDVTLGEQTLDYTVKISWEDLDNTAISEINNASKIEIFVIGTQA